VRIKLGMIMRISRGSFEKVIEKNFTDQNFSVYTLSRCLNVSFSNLFDFIYENYV